MWILNFELNTYKGNPVKEYKREWMKVSVGCITFLCTFSGNVVKLWLNSYGQFNFYFNDKDFTRIVPNI